MLVVGLRNARDQDKDAIEERGTSKIHEKVKKKTRKIRKNMCKITSKSQVKHKKDAR